MKSVSSGTARFGRSIAILVAVLLVAAGVRAQTTLTFEATGAMQTFTVPAGVTSMSVEVVGANGGDGTAGRGGFGGKVTARIAVTPGQILYLYVGISGLFNPWNGGGDGAPGCKGGDASDIRIGGTTLESRVVVAGGGGGCGMIGLGGDAGGLIGSDGSGDDYPQPGGGGNSYGGNGGSFVEIGGGDFQGGPGSFGYGGASSSYSGGGGGGGWYGGGAGAMSGGGGGSSYASASLCSDIIYTPGYNYFNGYITLTYNASANANPVFAGGAVQSLQVCQNAGKFFNSLLTINDPDAGQTETYTIITPPAHGTVVTGTTASSGVGITPENFFYQPVADYTGTDVFTVSVSDGNGGTATTTINVTVNALPTITPGTNPSVTGGATSASLPFTTTGYPATYTILYDTAAIAAGFTNVTNAVLNLSPITLTVPAAASYAIYNATVKVSNGGCNSTPVNFTVDIHPVQTLITYQATGAVQTFIVPQGVTSVDVDLSGASGGYDQDSTWAGLGGRVTARLAVSPGQVLNIYVGKSGRSSPWNGGGMGVNNSNLNMYTNGGDASDIRIDGNDLANRIIVAGGGGAGIGSWTLSRGGHGGGLVGANGTGGYNFNTTVDAGGGTQIAGGVGATYTDPYTPPGFPPTYHHMANGGFGYGGGVGNYSAGGGGWYGGGSGNMGGGAGGSSYADATLCTSVLHTQGYRTGDGLVVIKYAMPLANGPVFIGGGTQSMVTCQNTGKSFDTLLTLSDADTGRTESFSIIALPLHGSIAAGASVTSGTSVAPSGFQYIPANDYTGTDIFKVSVDNGEGDADTTTINVTVNAIPVVSATGLTGITEGQSVTLTATGAASYVWSPSSSLSSSTGSAVIATPSVTTIYTVTGTTSGCSATALSYVTVSPLYISYVLPTPQNITICAPAGATDLKSYLHANDPSTGNTVTWRQYSSPLHGSLVVSSATAPTGAFDITPGGTISYTPSPGYTGSDTFTIRISNGVRNADMGIRVNVVNKPNIITRSDVTICSGSSAMLTASGGTVYSWLPSSGLSASTGSTVTAFTSSATTYTVTGSDGTCSNTATVSINIAPNPQVDITGGSCTGSVLTLSSSVPYDTVKWYKGASVIKTTVAPSGPTIVSIGEADGITPNATFVTSSGDLYVSDGANNRILKYPAGFTSSTAGIVVASTGLEAPDGLFVDASGNIYTTSNSGGGHLVKFPAGSDATTIPQTVAQYWIGGPLGDVLVNATGDIYTNDYYDYRILKYPAGSDASTQPRMVDFPSDLVLGLAVVNDTVYATERNNSDVIMYTPDGIGGYNSPVVVAGSGYGSGNTQLIWPIGVFVDNTGSIYVTDQQNNRVQKFPPHSTSSTPAVTVAGGNGYGSGANQLASPTRTYVDAAGNIYIADNNNHRVQVYYMGGESTMVSDTISVGVPGAYSVTVVSTKGCPGSSDPYSVSDGPSATISIDSQQVCAGMTTSLISFGGGGSGTVYNWTNSNPAIGLAATGAGDIASFNAVNSTTATAVATITVTPSTNGCSGAPATTIITVKPKPSMIPVADQSRCNMLHSTNVLFGSVYNGTQFNWTNNDTSIGLPASGIGDIYSFQVHHSGLDTARAMIITTPVLNGCSGIKDTFIIAVRPTPVMNTVTPQLVCNGDTTTTVVFSSNAANTTYSWRNYDTATGLAEFGSGNISSFFARNTTDTNVTSTVRVTPILNSCQGTDQNFNITVAPSPQMAAVPPTVLCNGQVADSINFSANLSGTIFAWVNDNTSIGIGASGTGSITSFAGVNMGSATQTATVTVTPATNGCIGVSRMFTIQVNPTPVLSSTLAPADICDNNTFNYPPASATPGTTFTWSRAAAAGISNVANTGAANPGEVLHNTITSPVPVAYVYTLTAGGCNNSQTVNVMVNPTPVLSSTLTAAPVCSNAMFDYTPASTTSGAGFQWSRVVVAGISNGASSGNDDPAEVLNNITPDPVTVQYIYTLTANGCINTQSVAVTVSPTPLLSSPLTVTPVCDSSLFSYLPVSATAGTAYTWSRTTITGIDNGAVSGTGNPMEYLVNTTPDPVSVQYVYTLTASGCDNVQNVAVIVYPKPLLNTTLTPAAICDSTAFVYTPGSLTTGTDYVWRRAVVTGISNSANAGNTDPAEILHNTTPDPVAVTYVYTLTANGCRNTQNVTVNVKPTPVLSSALTVSPICDSVLFSYIPASLTTGTTFTWSRDTMTNILNSPANGIDNPMEHLVNISAYPQAVTYTYTLAANGCSHVQPVEMTVYPKPMLNGTLSPASVCDSAMFNYEPASLTSGVTYMWNRAAVTGIANAADTGVGNPMEVLYNTTPDSIAVEYIYTLTAYGCPNTQTVQVYVKPTPKLTSSLAPGAICNSTVFNYTPASATSGTNFTWNRAGVSGINNPAASGTGNPMETLTNTSVNPVPAPYVFSMAAAGCINAQVVTVNVNPSPALSSSSIGTICSGSQFVYSPGSATSGTTYTWTRAVAPGISNAAGAGSGSIDEVLYNLTNAAKNVTYHYTLLANGCSNPQSVTVTVNPTPIIPIIGIHPGAMLCSHTMYQNFGADIAAADTTNYTWTATNAVIYAAGAGNTNALISFPYSGTANVILTAGVDGYSCYTRDTFTVTVSTSEATNAEVYYVHNHFIYTDNTVDAYQWGYDDAGTLDSVIFTGQVDQNLFEPSPDFTNRKYWVMTTKGGCMSKSYYNAPTGINNLNDAERISMSLFPNPASDNMNIVVSGGNGRGIIELMDISGKVIRRHILDNHKATVTVSDLASGVYLVSCYIDGIKIATDKLIKR